MDPHNHIGLESEAVHVLLVEDEASHAYLLSEAIRSHGPGWRVTVAGSLVEARRVLVETCPSLLVVDLVLPDGVGTELLPADVEVPPYPLILLTSHGDEQVAVEAMKRGAFDYIVKSKTAFAEMPRIGERAIREWKNLVGRRQAEAALRRSEEHLRLALSAANVGTWEWDVCKGQLHWPSGLERLLGLEPGEFGGTFEDYLKRVHPDDLAEVERIVSDAMAETAPYRVDPYQTDHRVLLPDQRVHWLSVQGRVIRDASGVPIRMAGTIVDITARKNAEERINQMEIQLAHVARLSTMGEMVAGIAHEVNQPLYSILNFAKATLNVLSSNKAPNLDELREWNKEITISAARAGEIIKRLRGFVGKRESRRARSSINEIVKSAVSILAFDARRGRVAIRKELAEALPTVVVDSVQVQQVLVNLLRNAFESFESLHERQDRRVVRIETSYQPPDVVVSVTDNGPGLPAHVASMIFQPFVTTKRQGMGMGLAISKTIVEGHGGRLWASEDERVGASFHLAIPVPAKQESAVRP